MEYFRQKIIGTIRRQTSGSRASTLPLWLYLVAITAAELLTVFLDPLVGVICHSIILVALFVQSVFVAESQGRNLMLALTLVPLIRILSLSLPLIQLPQVYWYPLIYAPLLAATVAVMWVVGLKPSHVGLVRRDLFFQVLLGVAAGLAYGILEYMILKP